MTTVLTSDQLGAGAHIELNTPQGALRCVGIPLDKVAGGGGEAPAPGRKATISVNAALQPRSTAWREYEVPFTFHVEDLVALVPVSELPPGVFVVGAVPVGDRKVIVGLGNIGDSPQTFGASFRVAVIA